MWFTLKEPVWNITFIVTPNHLTTSPVMNLTLKSVFLLAQAQLKSPFEDETDCFGRPEPHLIQVANPFRLPEHLFGFEFNTHALSHI